MKLICLSVCLCCCLLGYSQQDSALYQLLQIPNDTERVNQIYKTGFGIRNTDPMLAYLYAQAAETEAKKTSSKKHLAKSYNLKGILHYKKGDYTKALSYQNKALRLNEADRYAYGIAVNQTNLGNIYSDIGYDALAESAYLQATKAYNLLNNRLQIENSLMNLGILKYKGKRYSTALKYFHTALAMAEEDHDMDLMASCYNNIGAVFMEIDKLDSALLYLEEGWKLLDLRENDMEKADVYNNIASVYIKKGEYEKAKGFLTLADSISQAFDYTDAKVHIYETYVFYFEKQQDYQNANTWLKKHYHLKDSILQLSKEDITAFPAEEVPQVSTGHAQTSFKNGWILIILGAFVIGIPLLLIQYKR